MANLSKSSKLYRNISIVGLLLGVVLAVVGYAFGGFTSVTWAAFLGAGVALFIHGLIGTGISFIESAVTSNDDTDKDR